MTRFAIDAGVALRLIREKRTIAAGDSLVAPAALRSDVMAMLYREVRAGSLSDREARELLEKLASLKVRLLGDRVSRITAWKIATELDSDDIARAEYIAVARLQADVLVASDDQLRAAAEDSVTLADFSDLAAN